MRLILQKHKTHPVCDTYWNTHPDYFIDVFLKQSGPLCFTHIPFLMVHLPLAEP